MLTRRDLLTAVPAAAAVAALPRSAAAEDKAEPWRFCLNTATIMGQNRPLLEEIDIAAVAGYQGIEPWINKIEQFQKGGGSLKDAAKMLKDRGLVLADAIGFPEWIVDDEAKRKKGLEDAKRAMDLVQQLGGKHLAAPPAGATAGAAIDLLAAADRYHALLEVGEKMGVTPILELWGHSKNIRRLGEALLVAAESRSAGACILPDVYHLRKGGSEFAGLKLVGRNTIGIFHVNDYPAMPLPATLNDGHRVYPGDGVAPWKQIVADLRAVGYQGMLSLELFNREYWKQDPLEVAKTGLAKLKAVVS